MKQLGTVWSRSLTFGLVAAFAACSGDGCGCTEPTPGGFPSAERTENAIQVRVTPTGIAAVEQDPAALVGSFLGTDDGTFPIPASCGGDPEICCDNGTPIDPCGPVNLDFAVQGGDAPRLEINPNNGSSQVQVIARFRIKTAADLPVSTNGVDCDISIDSEASGNESVTITLDLDLQVDPATNTTELANVNTTVSDLANGDVDISGGALCFLADVLLKGTIVGQLTDALEDTLTDTITNLSCKQCPSGDVADCGEFADACDSEICMRGGECLQELGIAGRVIAAKAFAGLSSGQLGAMDLYEVAGGYSEAAGNGISLGLLSGMIPAGTARDRCGPSSTRPPVQSVLPRSNFFAGNTRPDTGNPFGIGIGIHGYNLDLFSWSAYESGLLCLNIGAQSVDLLTVETFSIVMPSLLQLAHSQPAPLTLGLRPQSPPIFTLGAGTTDEQGEIIEPLINLEMPGLEIDFYAMIDDQWIRVMTLASDVVLPINLEPSDDGKLTPVIGDISGAFTNLSVTNSEALTESPADLAEQFPVLLELALPMLADGLEIDLPLLGSLELQVQPDGITSIESNSILAIFADLAVSAPMPRIDTRARVASVGVPANSAFARPSENRDARPHVTLDLGGVDENSGDVAGVEFSYRINRGLWSPYSSVRTRRVSSEMFWLQGRHEIEVRARRIDEPNTVDPTPAAMILPIDTVGPRVRARHGFADQILVSATDHVDRGALELSYRLGDGDWRSAGAAAQGAVVAIDLEGTPIQEVDVRATDSRGNASDGTTASPGDTIAFHGSGDASGCECDAGGGPSGGLLVALVTLLLLAPRKRLRALVTRRAGAFLAVLGLVVVVGLIPACSCGSSTECLGGECLEGEHPRGPTGRWLSMASDGSRSVATAYDEENGDLVLVDITSATELRFTAIAGVPDDVPPSYEPDTYRDGIAAPGADVGAWSSVALHEGNVMAAFQDLDNGALQFVRQDGDDFHAHEVDSDPDVNIGLYSSLVIRGGTPSIAYMAIGALGPDGTLLSQLRIARASSATPVSATDWTVEVVDEQPISCAGLCADGLECVLADAEVGLACSADTGDCAAACGEDQSCVAGACLDIEQPSSSIDLPQGTGLFANQVTLADGRAAIVHYRRSTGDLVVAVEEAGGWTVSDLDAAGPTDTGAFAAATLGADGNVHVAYQDAIGDRVMYLAWDGQAVVAGPEVVDDGVRDGDVRTHNVGAGMAIALNGGEIVIGYQDGLTSDLVVSRGGVGSWTRTDIATGAPLDGFYNRIAIGNGAMRLGTYRVDRSIAPPGEIVLTDL